MQKIFSKVKPEQLLHVVIKKEDITPGAHYISPESEFIQLAAVNMDKGKQYKAHSHIPHDKIAKTTQESIVVIQGKLKAIFYDLDDKPIFEAILESGDCAITLYGGHYWEVLEDKTIFYEYKNGPYFGIEKDKRFI